MAELLYGAPVAKAIAARTASDASALRVRDVTPTLAIVRVGGREDDLSYERAAKKRCAEAGVAVRSAALADGAGQDELLRCIDELNGDETVHGILLFRPLPPPLDGEAARRAIAPQKDVDGVTDESLAGVFTGSGTGFSPCTAQAVIEILDHYGIEISGKRAVVVGRSLVVGRPAAMLLLRRNATVTLCHTGTLDLPAEAREADILVAAAGRMNAVGADCFRPGQVILDVGIHMDEQTGRLRGDVCREEAEPIVSAVTPVPGGVGAVTTAVLVRHVAEAAMKQLKENQ